MKIAICNRDSNEVNLARCIRLNQDKFQNIKLKEYFYAKELLNDYEQGKRYGLIIIEIISVYELEVMEHIRSIDSNVELICISSDDKYILNAFRLKVFQYFIKPIDKQEFCLDFKRAVEEYNKEHHKFVIRNKDQIAIIGIDQIVYMEGYMRNITIITNTGDQYIFTGKLKDQEELLSGRGFVRTHQGYIVNLAYVKNIDYDKIITRNGISIPISVRRKQVVYNKFNNFISKFTV